MGFRIAVDIGGTFTDGVIEIVPEGQIFLAKRLTTHDNPGEALSAVVEDLLAAVGHGDAACAAPKVESVVHGSTLVTNALIERKGASTALVATAGTADILDIRREVRYDLYDLNLEMPPPLVPRELRFEIGERIAADGTVVARPQGEELAQVVSQIRASGVASVAVALLHSCVNAENENEIGRALREALPGVSVSLSSRVACEIREYERTTTTTANAYVQPLVKAYLEELEARLRRSGVDAALRVMLSSGGTTTASVAADIPIAAVESGPAGGVLSAANAGRASGFSDVLAFDMGGTTAKVCTVTGGEPSVVHMFETARVRRFKKGSGLSLLVASIDLIEIGSGGGSIARASELGLLTVGPESAGSYPGPACYGLGGTEPAVTDADLVLGYLNPGYFLGGRMRLDLDAAHRALGTLGERLGLSAEATAKGIFNVVNEAMSGAARVHIAEKAQDPRQFTLVATGGAGPMHAVEIARKLRVPRVLFPIAAGTGSCLGFLAAPMRVERSWSRPARLDGLDWDEIRAAVAAMRGTAGEEISVGLPASETVDWQLLVEMRYLGQGANVTVRFPYREPGADFAADLVAAFHKRYDEIYGGVLPAGIPETVTWRVVGSTRQGVRDFVWPSRAGPQASVAPKARRPIFCTADDAMREVPVYERYALPKRTVLTGPLILEEEESTIVVPVAARVEVLENLSVLVTLEA
ncbi:hydantoinase/oxoprolinase family protein [Xanthobacter dioxanivorans]|uniref:Hydantoinase/oxoprolinase family protein n=1 Tax=Xanthobacter dioxanivorans TaxID=2528964 RepID=A0A974PTM1_9HYPH|nr:hydantoinase/oxoprolinase family protein [Xanthobacter dioxanivorans]QRG08885.1 hydantoinase/oxoprolinase family protein [Xanthobacter dioxanivorans]